MRNIFHWFYCLPIEYAFILTLLVTSLFLIIGKKFRSTPYWKGIISILLICWIATILYGTLGQRAEGEASSKPILIPFHSYYIALNGGQKELFRANFMNTVLFYPAGLLSCALLTKCRLRSRLLIICAFALFSIGIEYTQYRLELGLAETDDVIHNTLGALLGVLACGIPAQVTALRKRE